MPAEAGKAAKVVVTGMNLSLVLHGQRRDVRVSRQVSPNGRCQKGLSQEDHVPRAGV